jgi:hypothetical protein
VGGTGSPGSRGGMWEKGEVAHTMYIHVNKCKNDKNNKLTHKKEKNCSDEVLFSCIPHMPDRFWKLFTPFEPCFS